MAEDQVEQRQLRVIIHLDLDCFYAQVEHERLKIPREEPLAVRQWASVIAVNYPARKCGVKRSKFFASRFFLKNEKNTADITLFNR